MKNKKNINNPESMLANMDRVMRQLRRRPAGSHHAGRGSYRLLKIISEQPGLSTKKLSEMMDIRRASLNEKLIRFEDKGIIKRERDSKDQRVQVIYIEKRGLEYLDRIQKVRSKKNDAITTVLTGDEIEELARLSGKLADGLEEIHTSIVSDYKKDKENKKEKGNVYEQ